MCIYTYIYIYIHIYIYMYNTFSKVCACTYVCLENLLQNINYIYHPG